MTIRRWIASLPPQARWLVLCIATCSAVVVLFALLQLSIMLVGGLAAVSGTTPKIGRLMGYEAASQEIAIAAAASKASLNTFAFDASVDVSQRGAELQKALRRFASESGLTIIGSQFVLEIDAAPPPSTDFLTLGVDLTMSGPPMGLDTFLTQVYEHEPALKVVSMNLQQTRRTQSQRGASAVDADAINIRTQVVALMVAP